MFIFLKEIKKRSTDKVLALHQFLKYHNGNNKTNFTLTQVTEITKLEMKERTKPWWKITKLFPVLLT